MSADGPYSRGHALEIARLPGSSLQLSVAKMIPDRLTREQTRRLVDSILLGKKSLKMTRPGVVSTQVPESKDDPLEDLWPDFMMNPWIAAPGSVRVRYLGDWKWSFEIPGPELGEKKNFPRRTKIQAPFAWLAQLLTRMGRSLSGLP